MKGDQQAAVKFFEDAKTDAHLSAALAKADNESDVAEVAKQHGYELDVGDIVSGWSRSLEAMDDHATRGVSGGISQPSAVPIPVSAGVGTDQWKGFWRGYAGGAYEEDFTGSNATIVEVSRPDSGG